MKDIAARYEFRIWAQALEDPHSQLERLALPSGTQRSEETYLISSGTDGCNAKIRNELLEVKLLIASDCGLEQWKPSLKAGFPLESSIIAAQIFPGFVLEAPPLPGTRYPLAKFLEEVIRPQPDIAMVPVAKARQQFIVGACQAEFSSVTINSAAFQTVAVESLDRGAALRLIRQLGIGGSANTSYIRQIKYVLGTQAGASRQ
jgi:hypothetical protein